MFLDHLRSALLITWLGLSTLLFPVLFLPFLVPRQAYVALGLGCESIPVSEDAPLRISLPASFLCIVQGRINAAVHHNHASVPLFSALVWNECVAIWYALGDLRRAWKGGRRREAETEEFSHRS